jgi:hypothetical protein
MNFVAVCANANLPLTTSKPRQQAFLKVSGAVTLAPAFAAEVKNELLPSSGCATRSRTTSLLTPGLRFWHQRSSPTCTASTPSHPPRPAPTLRRPIYIVSRACSLSLCWMVPPSAPLRPYLRLRPLRMEHLLPLAEASTLSGRRVHRAHPQLPLPSNHPGPAHPHHRRPSRPALVPPCRSGSGQYKTICTRPAPTTSIQPSTLAPTYLRRNAPSCKRRARSPPLGPSSGPPPTSTNPSSSRTFLRRPPPPALPRVALPLRTLARSLHTRPWYRLRRTIPRTPAAPLRRPARTPARPSPGVPAPPGITIYPPDSLCNLLGWGQNELDTKAASPAHLSPVNSTSSDMDTDVTPPAQAGLPAERPGRSALLDYTYTASTRHIVYPCGTLEATTVFPLLRKVGKILSHFPTFPLFHFPTFGDECYI